MDIYKLKVTVTSPEGRVGDISKFIWYETCDTIRTILRHSRFLAQIVAEDLFVAEVIDQGCYTEEEVAELWDNSYPAYYNSCKWEYNYEFRERSGGSCNV